MKKSKRIIVISVSIFFSIIFMVLIYFLFIYDANKLSIKEKEWLNNNKNNVISFGIPAGINVFSSEGSGVFYDFIDDLTSEYELNVDKTISNSLANLGFIISSNENSSDLLMYKDFYVVLSKSYKTVTNINDLKDGSIGGLSDSVALLSGRTGFTGSVNISDSRDALLDSFENGSTTYIFVPLNEYLNEIIENNYSIIYQFEDIPIYYYLHLNDNSTLNSIISKFYNIWVRDYLDDSYYSNLFKLYRDNLELSDLDVQSLTNKVYTFGFVNKTPYNIINSSRTGGIIFSYLDGFSKLTDVEFDYVGYKDSSSLIKSFNNNKIDLMFNDSNDLTSNIKTNINEKFYIISSNDNKLFYNDISQISNGDICVLENSNLSSYLRSFTNLRVRLVSNERKLINCTKKNYSIAIDDATYDFYVNNRIKDYHISYEGYNQVNYSFKYVNGDDTFFKIFSIYVNTYGNRSAYVDGLKSYNSAVGSATIIGTISKYVLIFVGSLILVLGLVISSRKRIKLNTRIRKDEKLRFVDMLTSLKNRNYLNDRIEIWNQNTIYPQAVIVIDLNNIKYLNDTFGHEEGDKQIMAAANVLHQNQVDNSEILRTDGNEFMVYLVGYSEKQVVNYIKKLLKEFNNLPYEYGAAIGFSMIVDDLKLIDDAINEASIQMRENKEIEYNENENK